MLNAYADRAKRRVAVYWLIMFVSSLWAISSHAEEGSSSEQSPPLPLHTVEGYGGVAFTGSAYLVNPAREGNLFGKPAVGGGLVVSEYGQYFAFQTLTLTLSDRLELGYGFNQLGLDSLSDDIRAATGVDIEETVYMHNLNARLALVKENAFNTSWIPEITIGAHGKFNTTVNDIDDQLGGVLTSAGITDQNGVDYTLYASKLVKVLPRPLLINAGVRSTKAAHIGLLGFTDERRTRLEGNVVMFATDRLLLGAEYRQKPDEYTPVPGPSGDLVGPEDDWWSLVFAYQITNNFTVSGAYSDFGEVLNEPENGAFGLKMKYEF